MWPHICRDFLFWGWKCVSVSTYINGCVKFCGVLRRNHMLVWMCEKKVCARFLGTTLHYKLFRIFVWFALDPWTFLFAPPGSSSFDHFPPQSHRRGLFDRFRREESLVEAQPHAPFIWPMDVWNPWNISLRFSSSSRSVELQTQI